MITTKLTRMCWKSWVRSREANIYKKQCEEMDQFIQKHMEKTCNTCEIQHDCTYVPGWGKPVRWNCPFFVGKEGGEK